MEKSTKRGDSGGWGFVQWDEHPQLPAELARSDHMYSLVIKDLYGDIAHLYP